MSKKAPACFAKSSGHVFNHPRREIELKESVLGSDWTWKLLMASLATTVDNTIKMADTVRKHGCQWCIRFGRPPSAGGRPNFHFVPYFSMRRPGQPKHAKLVCWRSLGQLQVHHRHYHLNTSLIIVGPSLIWPGDKFAKIFSYGAHWLWPWQRLGDIIRRLASNQALPALDTSHATCCYWRRLLGKA